MDTKDRMRAHLVAHKPDAMTLADLHRRLLDRHVDIHYSTVTRWFMAGDQGRVPELGHYAAVHDILGVPGDARKVWFDLCHPIDADGAAPLATDAA